MFLISQLVKNIRNTLAILNWDLLHPHIGNKRVPLLMVGLLAMTRASSSQCLPQRERLHCRADLSGRAGRAGIVLIFGLHLQVEKLVGLTAPLPEGSLYKGEVRSKAR